MATIADEAWARLQAYVGEFLTTQERLYQAERRISALRAASASGSAKVGTKVFTAADVEAMAADNASLLSERVVLQQKILDITKEWDRVKPMLDNATATNMMEIIAFGGSAVDLAMKVSRFNSRVKTHENLTQGVVSASTGSWYMGIGVLALTGLGLYFFGRRGR